MRRRAVIVDIGLVTPIGIGWPAFRDAVIGGTPGGVAISLFDATSYRTRVAAEVRGFDLAAHVDPELSARVDQRFDRKVAFGIAAAHQVLPTLDLLRTEVDPDRTAVTLGVGLSYPTIDDVADDIHPFVGEDGELDLERFAQHVGGHGLRSAGRYLHDELPRFIALRSGARGGHVCHFAACAAAAQAVGQALRLVQRDRADVVVTGAYDASINPWCVAAFSRLGALTSDNADPARASRPFDAARTGFVLGEGATILVVVEHGLARRCGLPVLAEIVGYGTSLDASHLTAPHPEGRGAVLAMQRALHDARLSPAALGYINPHGTGTVLNDLTEARAIREVLGDVADRVPVSSTKSMHGHALAAAGAIEIGACLAVFETGHVPPTINLDDPDPLCPLDHVPHVARAADVDTIMTNSFAFGGENASLVLRRPAAN